MEAYTAKLKELETLFSDMDGGLKPANSAEMEAALRATEELVDDLQADAELLSGNTTRHSHVQRSGFSIGFYSTRDDKMTSLILMMSNPCPIGLEKSLQGRLSSISRSQLSEGQDVQNIADAADDIQQRQQTYETTVEEVQSLMEEMKRKLDKAKTDLRTAVRHGVQNDGMSSLSYLHPVRVSKERSAGFI